MGSKLQSKPMILFVGSLPVVFDGSNSTKAILLEGAGPALMDGILVLVDRNRLELRPKSMQMSATDSEFEPGLASLLLVSGLCDGNRSFSRLAMQPDDNSGC
jgi:hypothetical protein